ncbi:rhodanese-like domain-containing protein [Nonomuraea sp. NPDC059194]|uniref:rhodanese-like domain-containing protein n=1 Tax=Nonomuraea sp. NPDC059194 TaxID=3346764 RepID=UPI0036AD9D1F
MGFSPSQLIPIVDEGLGNTAYLVALGDGRALAVDVSRDLRAVRRAAEQRGLTIAFTADTHLHADYLSGSPQLAHDVGATVIASAAGRRGFPHTALRDEDEVDLGGLTLRALETPGHTTEHLSFLLLDGDAPLGVFTGGSLIVGAAARTDLVSPDQTVPLARAQHASLRRLSRLPDEVGVWPTHGAGSFCSAPPSAERTSTIGAEKRTNPLLRIADPEIFARGLIEGLGTYPAYFSHLPEINRRGPAIVSPDPPLNRVPLDAAIAAGAMVVDVRPVLDFARRHVTGAVSIPLRPQFGTWLGWVVPASQPFVVVRNPEQDPKEIVWQSLKIGHENLMGEIVDDRHSAASTIDVIGPHQVGHTQVLDVRQTVEYHDGHLPGARHVELGHLAGADLGDEPLVVMCGHGERAATAASLLRRTGHRHVAILSGGPDDWSRITSLPLERDR